MAIDLYLNFNGNCRQAVEFYAEVFETEQPKFMTYGQTPPSPDFSFPEEAKSLILHTQLSINGSTVMFSDNFPGAPFVEGTNFSLALSIDNMDKIRALFNKLKEGGIVRQELQETFWSKCYGSLTDKFGISWQLNYFETPAK